MLSKKLEIVKAFKRLKEELPELIKQSGYMDQHIYTSIGLGKTCYYHKLKHGNWSDEEVEEILNLLAGKGKKEPTEPAPSAAPLQP
jgi:hypothetical protein